MTAFNPKSDKFVGTDNPRHLRVIQALMICPLPREQLDQIAGASNGPDLVAELRRRGLEIPCTRTKKKDIDGLDVLPGVYHFTQLDIRRVIGWLLSRLGVNTTPPPTDIQREAEAAYRRGYAQGAFIAIEAYQEGISPARIGRWYDRVVKWRYALNRANSLLRNGTEYGYRCPPEPFKVEAGQ